MVVHLEEMGAVKRQPHPHDRRAKGVILTEAGRRMRLEFWERLTNHTRPLGRLSSRELTALRGLLRSAMRES